MPNYLLVRSSLLLPLLALLFLFQGCQKEESEQDPQNTSTDLSDHSYLSGILIQTHFRGLVKDEDGDPLSGVYISIGNSYTLTDDEGFWQILNASVDSERAYVKAQKPGYFTSGRVLHPHENNFNRAFMTLMSLEIAGSVNGQTGGEVIHSSGAAVDLPANGIVDENGVEYTGQVNVALCYIDPSGDDFFQEMPGDLTALEEDGDFKALISYGMIGVELQGIAGQELQLADGQVAQITVPLPSQSGPDPSSTIPLWHFDEDEGVWKEDGEASLVGNEYIGEVSHFSFWNCDIPTDYVFLDGFVLSDEAAYPVQGVCIRLLTQDFGTGIAYSNAEGYFGGIIPANVVLIMEILSPCGELLSTEEIGPFSNDQTIPVIAIFEEQVTIITGNLVDCGGANGEGYISVNNPGYLTESVEVSEDGSFILNYGCPPQDVELIGYSPDYLTNSGAINVTTIPGESVDVGNIDLCAFSTDEYIVFSVLDETYTLVDSIEVFDNSSTLYISGYQIDENIYISFFLDDVPTPMESSFGFEENYFSISQIIQGQLNPSQPEMNWNFTEYSDQYLDYLEFNFSANYEIYNNGIPLGVNQVTGYGRVQRY